MKYKRVFNFMLFVTFVVILILSNNNSYVEAYNTIYANNINVSTTGYGAGYIWGYFDATIHPNIKFKSTDGKIIKDVFVQKISENRYYFDRHFVDIDFSKEYIFEVTDMGSTSILNLGSNRDLGTFDIYKVSCKENKISISKDQYEGIPNVTLKSLNLGTTNYGPKYVYGTIEYSEIVNRCENISK